MKYKNRILTFLIAVVLIWNLSGSVLSVYGSDVQSMQEEITAFPPLPYLPRRLQGVLLLSNGISHLEGEMCIRDRRYASPMECVPVAHAVTTFRLFPFSPS